MDAAAQAATQAAANFNNAGLLGSLCVILGLVITTITVVGWRLILAKDKAIEALNDELIAAERGFRAEVGSANAAVFSAVETLGKAMELVRSLSKGG